MFASINDIYERFGKRNVLQIANFESLDPEAEDFEKNVIPRVNYFLDYAFELIKDSMRQGAYNPEKIGLPYPKILIFANAEIAYAEMYKAYHVQDLTPENPFNHLIEKNDLFLHRLQGGKIALETNISKQKSYPNVIFT
jgi:hypothetical protein